MNKNILTLDELKDKIERLQLAGQAVYKTNKPLNKQLAQIFSSEDLSIIHKLTPSMAPNQLESFFKKTANYLLKIPIVNIYLGCYVAHNVTKKIHSWLCDKLKKQIVVNIITEESINNQVVVEYQGRRAVLYI